MSLLQEQTGRSRTLRWLVTLVLLCAVAVATIPPVQAQTRSGGASGEASVSREPYDEREVEKFLDQTLERQLDDYEIPGAAVSVVKDGKVLLAKDYGQDDIEAKEPVAADETLFKIASISKLFTATAVMQLAEEGRLDLDEDVNAYLEGFEVPDT